jgi:hypothetical protein
MKKRKKQINRNFPTALPGPVIVLLFAMGMQLHLNSFVRSLMQFCLLPLGAFFLLKKHHFGSIAKQLSATLRWITAF